MNNARTSKMQTERERILICVVFMIAAAWLAFYGCGVATAEYSFYLDRFGVSGQIDLSDEFDNSVIAPWMIFDPTVVESDGYVTFSNPGEVEEFVINGYQIQSEYSYIGTGGSSVFNTLNGNGDFTGLSQWAPVVPGENQLYMMKVTYTLEAYPHKGFDISIAVANWDTDAAYWLGISPGLGISFFRGLDTDAGLEWIWYHELIDESEITDAILLRLNFDDTADRFTADFSLDGGDSFQSPFNPIAWGMPTPGYYEWMFGAESIELQAIESLPVAIDIKPGGCPNPLNVNSNGFLPVAIVGTEDFDVTHVDPETVQLMHVDPLTWDLEDVCTAYYPLIGKNSQYDCTEEGPDGLMDLTLKFDTQTIVQALELIGGPLTDREEILVTLTGNLLPEYGGIPIQGEDVVRIINEHE